MLVLASASPRRRELLRYLGVPFTAIATTAEEEQHPEPPDSISAALPPFPLDRDGHPTLLAWRKASAGAERGYHGLVLGADTIVVVDGTILGKPRDEAEARTMLRMLGGRTHSVYTGIALLHAQMKARCLFDLVRSDVSMAHLSDEEIAGYVATGEPMDKAGAYGIQGLGGRLVQHVAGSYTCVVGLPLPAVHRLLETMGVENLVDPAEAFRQWVADRGDQEPPCTAP